MNQSTDTEQVHKIREYFQKRFNREFSDAEIEEIHQSLFYWGRAIFNSERRRHGRDSK